MIGHETRLVIHGLRKRLESSSPTTSVLTLPRFNPSIATRFAEAVSPTRTPPWRTPSLPSGRRPTTWPTTPSSGFTTRSSGSSTLSGSGKRAKRFYTEVALTAWPLRPWQSLEDFLRPSFCTERKPEHLNNSNNINVNYLKCFLFWRGTKVLTSRKRLKKTWYSWRISLKKHEL